MRSKMFPCLIALALTLLAAGVVLAGCRYGKAERRSFKQERKAARRGFSYYQPNYAPQRVNVPAPEPTHVEPLGSVWRRSADGCWECNGRQCRPVPQPDPLPATVQELPGDPSAEYQPNPGSEAPLYAFELLQSDPPE